MSFRQLQEALVLACDAELIYPEECCILIDEFEPKNHDFCHADYSRFDLNAITSAYCWTDYRFAKLDVPYVANLLELPDKLTCYNRTAAGKEEALCIMLRKLSSPCRYSDMVRQFGRAVPELSLIFNEVVSVVYDRFGHLLHTLDQGWLSSDKLGEMAQAVFNKGAALANCWGFLDGTVSWKSTLVACLSNSSVLF